MKRKVRIAIAVAAAVCAALFLSSCTGRAQSAPTPTPEGAKLHAQENGVKWPKEKLESGENGIPLLASDAVESIQYDAKSGHLLLCWDRGDTRSVKVVEVHSSAELYRWESPVEERQLFHLAGDNRVFVQKATDSAGTMWTVEY